MSKITAKGIWQILRNAGKGFMKDKVPKLSASLAYYTIFSLGPMLIVIIFLTNLFWGQQAVEGNIVGQLKDLIGNKAALQIQTIIKNASIDSNNKLTAIVGFITLLIGATTVFSEIQDSINSIWNLKVKAERGWLKMLITRLLSFSIVVALGFLLLVSLVVNALLEGLMNQLQQLFPDIAVIIIYILNLLLTLLVIGFLFAIIYKVLPDAVIQWRDVSVGALFTTVLFMIAKFGITFYIGKSDIGSTYGAAGSLVILLLWIYFSSMILYFGAEFTKAYAMKYGSEIKPNEYTVTVQVVQVESKDSVQKNEETAAETQKKAQEAKDSSK
ncbi:MAG: YihY/virulence factor BrkB family protein [Flavisolibacter sp.]|nr:YihY/virulence factor BrkB family protein [Flavisolibacter sp.]MBD0352201.1 YihY/virulence factor BrkB family protein [Flavisolibacter sp.]